MILTPALHSAWVSLRAISRALIASCAEIRLCFEALREARTERISVLTSSITFSFSTAAFAAVEVTDFEAKTVSITVNNVEQGEQVAIIITKGDAEDYTFETQTILFVDQKVAESAEALFEAEITDTSVNIIDIYAGYPSNSSANAVKVGNDIPITAETKLTLVAAKVVDDVMADEHYDPETMSKVNEEGTKGSVVWLKLNATNIAAGDLTKMFWAFHIEKDGKADTKYTPGDVAGLGLGTVLTGDVEIAAAFESTGSKVTAANAIFLLKGEDIHTAEGDLLEEIKGDKVEK